MNAKKKKIITPVQAVIRATMTKREAAELVAAGNLHIHSTPLTDKDPCAKKTQDWLSTGKVPTYPWEKPVIAQKIKVTSSSERHTLIHRLVNNPLLIHRREMRERLEITLEELLSNSLYHAYRNKTGVDKYHRKQPVELSKNEQLELLYLPTEEGIYLSLTDFGGNLQYEKVAANLSRCYGGSSVQIENKESGAGLGLYIIFDNCTHTKITCTANVRTNISCWISDKTHLQTNVFSFNYFSEGKK